MKRRNFVKNSSLIGLGSLLATSLMVGSQQILNAKSRGFKNMLEGSSIKYSRLPSKFKPYIENLKTKGFENFDSQGYTYNGHLMLAAKKSGVLFSKKGMLFITSSLTGFNHVFIEEKHLGELDEVLFSYTEGMKGNNFKVDAVDFLLPNKIKNKTAFEISYTNKLGNEFNFKRTNKRTKIFIS